jgi:hypothetical protein
MSITVLVTIEVEDFDACLEQFITAAPTRSKEPTAYRDIDNPNKVYILTNAPSKEAFIEEFRSPKKNAIRKGKQGTLLFLW